MATTIKELKAKINEQNLKMKNLRENINHLTELHAEDQRRIAQMRDRLNEKLVELQQAMTEIYCKSICMEHGEDVVDEETGEVIGKRLVFKALRQNDLKLNMTEELFIPEDEKYISTITIGVTYPEKGEEDED